MSDPSRAKASKADRFSNVAFGSVTQSAANTLTFAQIQMAAGIFQGLAMILHRILWDPSTDAVREIVAATDNLQMALTTSNRLTSILDITDPAIICKRQLVGVGANTEIVAKPIIDDFSFLPGGGKIIAANPIFLGMNSGGFAAARTMTVQLDFTFITLADKDYLELIQAQFPANL